MNISVIMVEPESPGNIGSVARVMKNFGVDDLVLVKPCEITEESYVMAVHAKNIVKKAGIMQELDRKNYDFLVGTSARKGGKHNVNRFFISPGELKEKVSGNVGIVLGRESAGLNNKELRKCDLVVHIPTHKSYKAMNISHACAIILYELSKQEKEKNYAGGEDKTAVFRMIDLLVREMGHKDKKREEKMKTVMKRIISKGELRKKEVFTIAGFFRNIMNQLRIGKK